jgi:hypothetical protein
MNKILNIFSIVLLITILGGNAVAGKKSGENTKAAKAKCLKENPELKGKKLQACIKNTKSK